MKPLIEITTVPIQILTFLQLVQQAHGVFPVLRAGIVSVGVAAGVDLAEFLHDHADILRVAVLVRTEQ